MATLSSSSSSLLISSPLSRLSQPSLSPLRFSFSSSAHFSSFLSISPTSFNHPSSSRGPLVSSFSVRASAAEKKKVLIVNTNSGAHAVIGFYFAKELLGSGHEATILTVGDETSDKMNKPPFNRFSVTQFLVVFLYLVKSLASRVIVY